MVTEYLLDAQPGLWKVIAADDGTNVNRYIHDPVRGRILQHEDPTGDWNWPALDGLGTVRGVYDDTLTEVYAADRDPYGDLIASTGSNPTPFEYTGEPEDPNGLLHLRARYYDPVRGVFNSLDPVEIGNRYAYVGGNPTNRVDRSGLFGEEDIAVLNQAGSCQVQPCICPPGSTSVTAPNGEEGCEFTFSGENAALEAVELANAINADRVAGTYDNWVAATGTEPFFNERGIRVNSAGFVSHSLLGGGFPMTNSNCGGGTGPNTNCGWRPGSNLWQAHDDANQTENSGLRAYLLGISPFNDGYDGSEIGGLGSANEIAVIPGSGNPLTQGQSPDMSRVGSVTNNLTSPSGDRLVGAGDYLYVSNPNSGDDAISHGFVIIGWGPAFDCNDPLLYDSHFGELLIANRLNPKEVPYVVDDGVQRNAARPFYCAGADDQHPSLPSTDDFFEIEEWYFYRTPRSIIVPCSRLP